MGDGSCRRDILDLGRDGILTQRPLGGGQKVLSVRVFRVENKEVQRALANGRLKGCPLAYAQGRQGRQGRQGGYGRYREAGFLDYLVSPDLVEDFRFTLGERLERLGYFGQLPGASAFQGVLLLFESAVLVHVRS